jgi:hypothetical protein
MPKLTSLTMFRLIPNRVVVRRFGPRFQTAIIGNVRFSSVVVRLSDKLWTPGSRSFISVYRACPQLRTSLAILAPPTGGQRSGGTPTDVHEHSAGVAPYRLLHFICSLRFVSIPWSAFICTPERHSLHAHGIRQSTMRLAYCRTTFILRLTDERAK